MATSQEKYESTHATDLSGVEREHLKIKQKKANRDLQHSSLAVVWNSSGAVDVQDLGLPLIVEPGDAIVRITTTAICGSDLHLYLNELPTVGAMQKGDVLGHEAVGVVQEVGSAVKHFKKGDRVVVSAVIACGECEYCQKKQTSLCNGTNPSKTSGLLYGHRMAGIFGYSHLTGGYDGLQAEHTRVPLADVNLLKLPSGITDEAAIGLSDIVCTAWHGLELAEVEGKTESLAVWGAGPVGLMTVHLAKYRGVKRIVCIDHHDYRLERARYAGAETINFDEGDVVKTLTHMFPTGIEKCIDCVGYRFPKSFLHRFSRSLHLETDAVDVIDEMVKVCKKAGNIALIGDYFGTANAFPIGTMMEKGFTVRGGQLWVHKYWEVLLKLIQKGDIDPTFVISHVLDLANAADAYRIFEKRQEGCIKVLLKTKYYDDEHARERKSSFVFAPKTTVTVTVTGQKK